MPAKRSERANFAATQRAVIVADKFVESHKIKQLRIKLNNICTKKSSKIFTQPKGLAVICLIVLTRLIIGILLGVSTSARAVAPTIDYSHNMRVLKLPRSTQVGELIYRLKGSDGDAHGPLAFGVSGIEARQLLDVVAVPNSWNEADVYLRAPLEAPRYNLSVFVSDGNMSTTIESTILVTNDEQQHQLDGSAAGEPTFEDNQVAVDLSLNSSGNSNTLSPFVRPAKHVFSVPENTRPGEPIGLVSVRESSTSELPVRFELRGKGAERFAIKYVFGPRGQSRGQLELAQPVDYEQQNLYALKVLALNAWTNTRLDTRNVATLDILVAVGDVQDTAPQWTSRSARLISVANTQQAGELVGRVEALDADYADQRPIGYALDAGSPLTAFLDIGKTSGEIRLRRAASELASALGSLQKPFLGDRQVVVVFASELPDTSSYEHLWPPMFAQLELPLVLVDAMNEAPQFYGGFMTNESLRSGGARLLHGYLAEPHFSGANRAELASKQTNGQFQVRWFTNGSQAQEIQDDAIRQLVAVSARGRPVVVDFGQGSNGTFELTLEGKDAAYFELVPSFAVARQTTFDIYVRPDVNQSVFDRDLYPVEPELVFQFELVARDFGVPQRMASRIKCLIELLDANDHSPVFERDFYTFQVYESSPPGQLLGSVRALDRDSRSLERVHYSALTGKDSHLFHLDQESGLVTLVGPIDREKQAQYLLLAEARDSLGASNYTRILVNVLDVNDNAPVFAQAHYDALLQPDGQFETPLVVRALDADEPNSANSQVAYEIIAGNQNEHFSIDSLSGLIYPASSTGRPNKVSVPAILTEPIAPFHQPSGPLDSAGKILPAGTSAGGREVEETTQRQPLRLHWPPVHSAVAALMEKTSSVEEKGDKRAPESSHRASRLMFASAPGPKMVDLNDQMPALDLLLDLESERASSSGVLKHSDSSPELSAVMRANDRLLQAPSSAAPPANFEPLKLPPVTTLIVRAHDFGIPIRSTTCKVSIYNLAIQSRQLSVILNGTVEHLKERIETIERSFGALTGSRAQIESLEALSDSSSFSVARVRLLVPAGHHQLVDLTDLSALMQALDYKLPGGDSQQRHSSSTAQPPTYIIPMQPSSGVHSNLSSGLGGQPVQYVDSQINPFALESGALEKRLLIYIIIVAICILALLVIWMIYSCCHEDKVKIIEKPSRYYRRQADSIEDAPSENDQRQNSNKDKQSKSTKAKQVAQSSQTNSAIGNNLAKQQQQQQQLLGVNSGLQEQKRQKFDLLSMYNGQVWFGSGAGLAHTTGALGSSEALLASKRFSGERRASSAPSNSQLDYALRAAINGDHGGDKERQSAGLMPIQVLRRPAPAGQFFPNAQGYVDNIVSIERAQQANNKTVQGNGRSLVARRHKVAPMEETSGGSKRLADELATTTTATNSATSGATSRSNSSASCESCERHSVSRGNRKRQDSVLLESDQELLGFDSTGTPIIATHTGARHQSERAPSEQLAAQVFKAPAGAMSYIVPLTGATLMTHEQAAASNSNSALVQENNKTTIGEKKSEEKNPKRPLDGAVNGQQKSVEAEKLVSKEAGKETEKSEQSEQEPRAPVAKNTSLIGELNERLSAVASGTSKRPIIGGQKTLQRQSAEQGHAGSGPQRIDSTQKQTNGVERVKLEKADRKEGEEEEIEERVAATSEKEPPLGQREDKETADKTKRLLAAKRTSEPAAKQEETAQKRKLVQQRTMSEDSTMSLKSNMQNRELLEKQSIFAMTYSGLATDKLPI